MYDISLTTFLLLQAQSSPAHTMDRFLPKKLQDAAAAATAARAKSAGSAGMSESQKDSPNAGPADKTKERATATAQPSRPDPVASTTLLAKIESLAAPQVSRPYFTPMPAEIKPAGITPKRAILQQDYEVNSGGGGLGLGLSPQGYKHPIEATGDLEQIEQGLEFLGIDGADRGGDDDLDAPSSFCCPITTVSTFTHVCAKQCCVAYMKGLWLQSSEYLSEIYVTIWCCSLNCFSCTHCFSHSLFCVCLAES